MSEFYDYAGHIVDRAKSFVYDELYRSDPPLGKCPACKTREVYEQSRLCSFIVWKGRNGRYIASLYATASRPFWMGF